MKTKRFYIIGAVLLAAMGTFAYQNHESTKPSDLALNNIEAISRAEKPNYTMQCTTSIQYTGGNSMPLYCGTCSFRYGYVATGSYSTCP